MNTKRAAELLDVNPVTVMRMTRDGRLTIIGWTRPGRGGRGGRPSMLFAAAEVRRLAAARRLARGDK